MLKKYVWFLGLIFCSSICSMDNTEPVKRVYSQEQKDRIMAQHYALGARLNLTPYEMIRATPEDIIARPWPLDKSDIVTLFCTYLRHEVVQETLEMVRKASQNHTDPALACLKDPDAAKRFCLKAALERARNRAGQQSGRKQ